MLKYSRFLAHLQADNSVEYLTKTKLFLTAGWAYIRNWFHSRNGLLSSWALLGDLT